MCEFFFAKLPARSCNLSESWSTIKRGNFYRLLITSYYIQSWRVMAVQQEGLFFCMRP